jgi:hypothetical protein
MLILDPYGYEIDVDLFSGVCEIMTNPSFVILFEGSIAFNPVFKWKFVCVLTPGLSNSA